MSGEHLLHYEIVRPLGRGGMGEVVEAIDTRLDRHVALKFVAPEHAADPEHLRRFEREARSAASLSHPHIATVHAFERAPSEAGSGERRFIAMELLSGRSLRGLLRDGALPRAQALRIARDALSALAFAHAQGIVHRDVKPENLMFDRHDSIKLTDFGLAHAAHQSHLTVAGTTLGTAAYLAPEAIHGQAGAKSDVFSAGVVLFEMLTGELPFAGDAPLAIMFAIANSPPKPLRERMPDADEGLVALVAGLLEKDPATRLDAAAAVREIGALLGERPSGAVSLEAATQALPTLPGPSFAGRPLEHRTTDRVPPIAEAPTSPMPALKPRTQELEAERVGSRLPVTTEHRAPPRRAPIGVLIVLLVLAVPGWFLWQRTAAGRRAQAHDLNDLGYAALQSGDLAAARTNLAAAARRDPGFAEAQINLALLESVEGHATDAAQRLARVVREHGGDREAPLRSIAHVHLGDLAAQDENWSDAVREFQAAFAADSSGAAVYNQLGWALTRAGTAAEAIPLLERAAARFPQVAPVRKNLALARLASGDAAGAERAGAAALVIDPTYAAAHAALARAFAQLGRANDARTEWQAFLASAARDPADSVATAADLARLHVLQ